jgi:hypothetical protein
LEALNLERPIDFQYRPAVISDVNAHAVVRATFGHRIQGQLSQGHCSFVLHGLNGGEVATFVVGLQIVVVADIEIVPARSISP